MRNFFVVTSDKELVATLSGLTASANLPIEMGGHVDSLEQLFPLLPFSLPAIILFDWSTTGSPGDALNLLEETGKRFPRAKVILAGEACSGGWIIRFFRSGAHDCIFKPINQEEMKKCIEKAYASLADEDFKEKAKRLEGQIQRLKPALAAGFVYDLIFSTLKSAKEIWERTKILGLSSNPNVAMVLSIDNYSRITANKSEFWKLSFRQEIYRAVQESLKSIPGTLGAILGHDSIVMLCALETHHETWKMKQEAIELAEHVKAEVEKKIDVSLTIGIGNFYEDARNLHLSYAEAVRAQRHKFFIGDNQVIHIDDVEPIAQNAVMLPLDQEPELLGRVRSGDACGAQKSLTDLMDPLLSDTRIPPELMKIQIMELLVVLGRAAIEGGADSKKILPLQFRYASELFNIETSGHLKAWLGNVVDEFIQILLLSRNERNLRAVSQAVDYIEANYDCDLSLKQVADHVHLSPNYFSQIFKKETGTTFIEYLTHIRIQKAKELLRQSNHNVSEVSRIIGYQDPRYFSKVFKTVVGISPSNFKNYG